jgi:hypothetical protein
LLDRSQTDTVRMEDPQLFGRVGFPGGPANSHPLTARLTNVEQDGGVGRDCQGYATAG